MYYVFGFVLGIYANMRALASSNVETIIVFRTCVPLCVSILDWHFLGRELPSPRSSAALLLILLGTLGYVMTDKQFGECTLCRVAYAKLSVKSLWGCGLIDGLLIYFLALSFTFTYGKYVISSVDMNHPVWGSVYYTNALSILPMMILGFGVFDESKKFGTFEIGVPGLFIILVTCVIGFAISYAGMNCRNLLSATAFTVVGVLNKMGTVLVNSLIWDKHVGNCVG